MINLNIEQNNNILKNINENLLEFLYNFSKGLDSNIPQYMKGRLEVMHGYADAISFLTSKFKDLYINSSLGTYIRFKDSVVQEKLANKWGDGVGITTQEAALQTSGQQLRTLFIRDTNITKFDELKYFIGIKELPSETFRSCSNLESIDLQNVERITGNSCFYSCNKLTNIGDYSNLTRVDPNAFSYTDLTGEYDFSNINEFSDDSKEALGFVCTLNLISVKMPATQETMSDFYGSGVYHITNCLGIIYIGNERLRNCRNLQELDCPNLERITGSNNFLGDTSLKTVNFPKLNYIEGTSVFSDCKSLEEITLGPITKFNTSIFYGCSNLTTINCDFSKIISIEQSAFYNCSNIAMTFDCPNCVSIGNNSFRNCTSLQSVNFPNLSSIGNDSFNNCTSLTTVNFENAESISDACFYGCKSLISINIPNVNIIYANAFNNCTNLQSVTVGNNLNEIYHEAFKKCESLTAINNINWENIQSIGDYAFDGCINFLNDYEEPIVFSSLTSLTDKQIQGFRAPHLKFPAIENIGKLANSFTKTVELHLGITSLPNYAFFNCKSLISVSKLENITSVGNECFRYDNGLTSLDFSSNLKSIGNSVFQTCNNIEYISTETIYPASIGYDAFNGCSKLKGRIDLSQCTSIGNAAFQGCTSLTSIGTLSPELTTISAFAFCKTGLTGNLDIPASVASIGGDSFRYMSALTSLTFNSLTPPERTGNTHFNNSTYIIYVPASAVETYKSVWADVASRIQAKP